MLPVPSTALQSDHQTVNGGTQWMVLTAAVNSPMVCGAREGTGSACYGQPPRQTLPLRLRRRGSRALPSAPRSSPGAEACRAIEADLGAISPGRAAAGGGHGRLAESERAFCTIMSDILMQRAGCATTSLHVHVPQ